MWLALLSARGCDIYFLIQFSRRRAQDPQGHAGSEG